MTGLKSISSNRMFNCVFRKRRLRMNKMNIFRIALVFATILFLSYTVSGCTNIREQFRSAMDRDSGVDVYGHPRKKGNPGGTSMKWTQGY
jgi:hypothetical protein